MITFKILRFSFVVCVSHTINELVTDIILIITSQEHYYTSVRDYSNSLAKRYELKNNQEGLLALTFVHKRAILLTSLTRISLKSNHCQVAIINVCFACQFHIKQ